MAHVLPFKQKQIEQRRLEAEAEKTSRIKTSEGAAQARVIEASGEADSRRKLADAEAYRQEVVGKVATAQLERDERFGRCLRETQRGRQVARVCLGDHGIARCQRCSEVSAHHGIEGERKVVGPEHGHGSAQRHSREDWGDRD